MLKRLKIDSITIPRDRRTPTKGRIASIAQSFRQVGQLNPITVDKQSKLIAGLTRIEAAKMNEWTDILAHVIDVDKLHAELAEIDENIERSNLTALEEAKALARRKKIYIELHPETAQHVAGGVAKSATAESAVAETPSFAKDTAQKTGKAERTVRENVAIGESITKAAAKLLEGTQTADHKGELQQLAKLEPSEQVAVAKAIKSGEAETVSEACTVAVSGKNKNKPVADKTTQAAKNRTLAKSLIDKAARAVCDLHEVSPNRAKRDEIVKMLQAAGAMLW